jgi:carbon storage regulator CsrA
MLVLSRKLNQKVLFPGIRATVQIVAVKGNVVRLGIDAPPGLTIVREEIAAPQPSAETTEPAEAIAAALSALGGRERAGLPPGVAADLTRIEADLQALRARITGQTPAVEQRPGRPSGGAGQRRRALLVEDNANERELLATFLRMAGLSVDTAGDGADALGYLQTHARPDVILLDMAMPRCDGPTAVRAIRKEPTLAGVKIVAVTGHAAEEFDLSAGPAGVDRWFQKPVDPAALVRELEREFTAGQGRP